MRSIRSILATVMAAAICLLFMLAPPSAFSEQPIEGAFGQRLGAPFDPATSTQSTGDINTVTFWYPDPVKIPELTEFFVLTTPITYRIYAIVASGEAADQAGCVDSVHGLVGVVSKKYLGDQYDSHLRKLNDEETFLLLQGKTHRRIRIGCQRDKDGKLKLEMAYGDETVEDAGKSEEQESAQIHADFEAQNYARILPRLQELARRGNLWAETTLGLMYGHGYGATRDEDAAEDYYLKAAKQGSLGAEFNLGAFYQDRFRFKPAETWLLKAAERGYSLAEENLSQLYHAKSPLLDEEKSFQWALRAAEHGRPEAQYNTCYSYADGLGVTREMVEAYKWCYIAARHGQRQAPGNRDHLAQQMRPDEIAKGREAAERWLAHESAAKE